MSEPFIGEIRMFAGTFAPRGWAFCEGQLLPISQHDALFSLLGTIYGGDSRTTFGLPDMRGRIPIHTGSGPGLSPRSMGQKAGDETATVTSFPHNHTLNASSDNATVQAPGSKVLAKTASNLYGSPSTGAMAGDTIVNTGGGQTHNNMMPSLCVNFIIALFGIYPSRN